VKSLTMLRQLPLALFGVPFGLPLAGAYEAGHRPDTQGLPAGYEPPVD